jgi:hypothetical protein
MTAIIPIPAFVDNYIRLRITTAITSAAIARWRVPRIRTRARSRA